jgi:hypothetical protein
LKSSTLISTVSAFSLRSPNSFMIFSRCTCLLRGLTMRRSLLSHASSTNSSAQSKSPNATYMKIRQTLLSESRWPRIRSKRSTGT